MTKAEHQSFEVVYLGQRALSVQGKAAALFITPARLNQAGAKGGADLAASKFDPKTVGQLIVGGIYNGKGEVGEDGKVEKLVLTGLEFVKRIESAESAEWELLDEAARSNVRAASQERKIKADKVIWSEIRSLRQLYMVTPASLKPALELAILKAIRGI